MNKKQNKSLGKYKSRRMAAVLLSLSMIVSAVSLTVPAVSQAAVVKLDRKKVTVTMGKSTTLKLKNNKAKVKWSVTSGKKNVLLSKKKKTSVKISGKKVGKAKVQAKVGKKKYTCVVTVKQVQTPETSPQPKEMLILTSPLVPVQSELPPVQSPTVSSGIEETEREVIAVQISANRNLLFPDTADKTYPEEYLSSWLKDNGVVLKIEIIYADEIRTIETTLCEDDASIIPSGMTISCSNDVITVSYMGKVDTLDIDYVKSQTEGDYEYISNGTVAYITKYLGENTGKVIIPDLLGNVPVTDIIGWESGDLSVWDIAISEITLPVRLDTRNLYQFMEWKKLQKINTKEGAENYRSIDGVLFSKDGSELLCYPSAKETVSYVVPDTVTTISERAFRFAANIKEITLPAKLCEIADIKLSNDSIEYIAASNTFYAVNLEQIIVAEDNLYLTSREGVLYDKDMRTLLVYPSGKSDLVLEVPEGVETVAWCAIPANQKIETLILPSTLMRYEYQGNTLGFPPTIQDIYIKKNCLSEEEWSYLSYYMDNMTDTTFHVKSEEMYWFMKTIWSEWENNEFGLPVNISTDYNW